jgi:hypothetical protein
MGLSWYLAFPNLRKAQKWKAHGIPFDLEDKGVHGAKFVLKVGEMERTSGIDGVNQTRKRS